MPPPSLSLSALGGSSTTPQAENKDVASLSVPAQLVSPIRSADYGTEVDTISERLNELQEELLVSLKEDISDWIIKTLGHADINAENFIHALDNGIILCKLSMVIDKKAQECFRQGLLKEPLPSYKLHCDETATSGTWYARDNTANFLGWCRAYGMTDETLFDSEDLVTHHHERQVIYCLMELARLGARFGLEPPSLITMEKEIDNEMTPHSVISTDGISQGKDPRDEPVATRHKAPSRPMEPPDRVSSPPRKPQDSVLDTEVYRVSLKCQCEKFVNKLREGVFNVYGKRVFIRLLKGKHLMVRVGGGWDTFENYLLHHVPVQVYRFSQGQPRRTLHISAFSESSPGRFGHKDFLVIRSKYKSSSFCG